jgi:hypothetical protein
LPKGVLQKTRWKPACFTSSPKRTNPQTSYPLNKVRSQIFHISEEILPNWVLNYEQRLFELSIPASEEAEKVRSNEQSQQRESNRKNHGLSGLGSN